MFTPNDPEAFWQAFLACAVTRPSLVELEPTLPAAACHPQLVANFNGAMEDLWAEECARLAIGV